MQDGVRRIAARQMAAKSLFQRLLLRVFPGEGRKRFCRVPHGAQTLAGILPLAARLLFIPQQNHCRANQRDFSRYRSCQLRSAHHRTRTRCAPFPASTTKLTTTTCIGAGKKWVGTYWYEHTLSGHKLILSSSSAACDPVDGNTTSLPGTTPGPPTSTTR